MSTDHGPVIQKSIADLSKYLKLLIPASIPEVFELKPQFREISNTKDVRKSIVAYRNFLYILCDYLYSDGDSYFKLKKNPKNSMDYPFLYSLTDLLADIGYHSRLSENKDSLVVTKLPLFTPTINKNGKRKSAKNSKTKLMKGLRFLKLCGFTFTGIDLESKKIDLENNIDIRVKYPQSPLLLMGLKIMAIADIELREKRYKSDFRHDNLLRCEYRLVEQNASISGLLHDFLSPLSKPVQNLALDLHHYYESLGMTCVRIISTLEVHFAYAYIKNSQKKLTDREIYQKRLLSFSLSIRNGFCLVIKPQKIHDHPEVLNKLSTTLQSKISKGYGCDRKLYQKPCQGGCEGIRLTLDSLNHEFTDDIKVWIDQEVI